MIVELNYAIFSLILTVCGWVFYLRQRRRGLFYLSVGCLFLTLSMTLRTVESFILLYKTRVDVITLRLLELSSLGLFALFTIFAMIALREVSRDYKKKHSAGQSSEATFTLLRSRCFHILV